MRLMERLASRAHVALYRVTGGRLLGRVGGAPVLVFTTVGRRSGRRRSVPLVYVEDGGTIVLTAPVGPSGRLPSWFLNARARQDVDVLVGRDLRHMHARQATPAEHQRLWPKAVEAYPAWEKHRARAGRDLPLVVLSS